MIPEVGFQSQSLPLSDMWSVIVVRPAQSGLLESNHPRRLGSFLEWKALYCPHAFPFQLEIVVAISLAYCFLAHSKIRKATYYRTNHV